MEYFDLINSCLVELNFRKQLFFSNLTKLDHLKIKNLLNRVNAEICSSENWWFRESKTTMTINANTIEHSNPVNGKITGIIIDNLEYFYDYDFEKFYKNTYSGQTYSFFNDKILFPKLSENKTATIFYLTNNFAKNAAGELKSSMVLEDDTSIIPESFQESILVYGVCTRFKAMPTNPKYQHWLSEYTNALRNLRSQGFRAKLENPEVIISKQAPSKSVYHF